LSDLMPKGLVAKRLEQNRLDHRPVVRQCRFGDGLAMLPLFELAAEALPQDELELFVRDAPHRAPEGAFVRAPIHLPKAGLVVVSGRFSKWDRVREAEVVTEPCVEVIGGVRVRLDLQDPGDCKVPLTSA